MSTKNTEIANKEAAALQAQINVDLDLFGLKLSAIYDHSAAGETFLVLMKQNPQGKTKIKFSEIATRFKKDVKEIDSKAEVEDVKIDMKWPEGVDHSKLNDLTITINQVYFYLFRPVKSDPQKPSLVEYAFSIDIDGFPKIKFPINVDKVGIRFWKTENKKVIESLNLINFDDYKPKPESDTVKGLDSGSDLEDS